MPICALPGTGKTWSLMQLALLLAIQLEKSGGGSPDDPVKPVPLMIPVQRPARQPTRCTCDL